MKKLNFVNVGIGVALFVGGVIAGVAMSDTKEEIPLHSRILSFIRPAPVITSIEPQEAGVGTIITIRGKNFRQLNDVGFRQAGSEKTYYKTNIPLSPDGRLTFELPDTLGVCPSTQPMPKNTACIDIGIQMPTGQVEVLVVNANGWSKPVPVTVKPESRDPQLELLRENPFHPALHAKPLAGKLAGLYSFRITRDWRVIFQFTAPDTIVLRDVGHRKDIYR